jgi:voltage-gated potassium channel
VVNRSLTAGLLRPVLLGVVPLVWYLMTPLDRRWTTFVTLSVTAGLVLVGVVVGWQVRVIIRSPCPRLRAVAALVSSFPLLIVVFATTYVVMASDQHGSFSESLTRIDALYYAMSVFTTVGFGDIAAQSEAARTVTMVQMLADLVYVGLLVRLFITAAGVGTKRRAVEDPMSTPGG